MKKRNKHLLAQVLFREGAPDDLKVNPTTLKYGQAFVVINSDEKTLSGFHIITEDTDPKELAAWLNDKRLYVPVSCLDEDISIKAKTI